MPSNEEGVELTGEAEGRSPGMTAAESPEHPDAWLGAVACPYCAALLDPPPQRTRRCPYCRQQIVVRHVDGRRVVLTEAAVAVFESERHRLVNERRWASERDSWLELAADVGSRTARDGRLAARPPSAATASAARRLYLTRAERAVRDARRDGRWSEVAHIRRQEAGAQYRASGGAVPPPADVLALAREASAATLRSFMPHATEVEVAGARCCPACRIDDGLLMTIVEALREPRLPHEGCPKGICPCDWWPLVGKTPRRRKRLTSGAR